MKTDELKRRLEGTGNSESHVLCQISREMRATLDGIMGFTHLLASQRSGLLNDKQSRYVSEIYENGKQLHSLVTDYVDLARLEEGLLNLNYASLDINEYFLWALDVLQPRLKEKGIGISVIWKTPRKKIEGDPARLKQIIFTIVSRAVEFSLKGEKLIVAGRFEEGFLKVCLNTDSAGLEGGKQGPESSGDPGQENRLNPNAHPFDVSLALAQKLIQRHGGEIGLESSPDSGSCLWLTLPEKRPNVSMVSVDSASPESAKSPALRILIVDDSLNMQNLVREILKKEKYRVFVADNGQTGVEMARQCRPDLIFMDINMPVMNGAEAVARLRALPGFENIPVIALTAYELENGKEELLKMGFTRYLSKPFGKPDLLEAIRTCIPAGK